MLIKSIHRFWLVFILLGFCSQSLSAQDHQSWSYNLSIYEVNVRQYTTEGTFEAFKTHLGRLKELGVGILWFMPIHPIGIQNRLGSLGSYYSVRDYYDVNSEFGTMEDFKSLVDTIHSLGMYVLIDWVANHTAWDNPLTISNPEWYSKDGNGNFIPPPGTNWTDVIDLDYNKQGLRSYMIDAMKYWIEEADIDGFRYDAASMVPLDFWQTVNTELKILRSDILLLAEDDSPQYQSIGIDMSFGWGYYGFGNGVLAKISDGIFNANNLAGYAMIESQNYSSGHYRMYFTSNHDENSWYGTVFERFGNAAEIFAVITQSFSGMPLIYSGQEAGLNKRLLFFDKDQIPWQQHSFSEIYSKLLRLKKQNKALWNGTNDGNFERVLSSDNPSILAFIRIKENDKVFGVFNLTNQSRYITLEGNLYVDNYIDIFSGDSVSLIENQFYSLVPWGYKLYSKTENVTSITESVIIPEFELFQNYPNPFNPVTKIKYSIPESVMLNSFQHLNSETPKQVRGDNVRLVIYNILGSEIAVLVNEQKQPGIYEVDFDAGKLSSGIYFYRLEAGQYSSTRKMILLK